VHDLLGIEVAHDGELAQVLRLAVHVGAHVEHDGVALAAGEDSRQRREVDAGHGADDHLGDDHGGAGVAGGDHGLRAALLDQLGADADRGTALLADRGDGRLVHAHHLVGVDDGDAVGEARRLGVASQLRLHPLAVAHQEDGGVIVGRGAHGAFHRALRRVVSAHGVNGDRHASPCVAPARWAVAGRRRPARPAPPRTCGERRRALRSETCSATRDRLRRSGTGRGSWRRCQSEIWSVRPERGVLGGFFSFDHRPAVVVTAVRAGAVGQLCLAAVRAERGGGAVQGVVRPAAIATSR
jgi:hypothetical protein